MDFEIDVKRRERELKRKDKWTDEESLRELKGYIEKSEYTYQCAIKHIQRFLLLMILSDMLRSSWSASDVIR